LYIYLELIICLWLFCLLFTGGWCAFFERRGWVGGWV